MNVVRKELKNLSGLIDWKGAGHAKVLPNWPCMVCNKPEELQVICDE